jgi:hypothetical protein
VDLCFSISSLGIALNKGFFEKRSFGLFLGVCAVTAQGGREQKNELTVWWVRFFFVLLSLLKVLSLERTKKNEFSFGSLLAYSYLCSSKPIKQ